jgi:hypothetical protein
MHSGARVRSLALFAALLIGCQSALPVPPASPAATPEATVALSTPTPTPTPTPKPVPAKGRSVSALGASFVVTGDFRGTGDTQVAVIDDPTSDLALRISYRDSFADTATPAVWLQSDRDFLSLDRAKVAVADVDADGKDDLVLLYNSGDNTARLFVFRSTGSAFVFAGPWWSGDLTWSRARNIVGGHFSPGGKDTLLVTYQDDQARMRVLAFDPSGGKFSGPATVYDSGKGQFDLAKTRFAVGRFTRIGGPDQLAALTQSESRAKLVVFDAGPDGLQRGLVTGTDTDYDVGHAVLQAADLLGNGHDELLSLYTDAAGGARVHVFDLSSAPTSSLTPLMGWDGWAALPAGAVCGGRGALAIGDWDRDGRADAAALAPALGLVRATVLATETSSFTVSSTGDAALRCPTWPLTGLPLGFGDATKRPLYVKTDNNPTARPHYGISKADMVFEWLIEGFTTRLAAVYQSQQPDVIGSVRSVRMTDRHVLPSLDAVLVYSGGGPEELMAINYDANVARRYVDLSPNYGWSYRVPFRPAPYNLFTSYSAVRAAMAAAPDADQPAIVASWRFLRTSTQDTLAGGFASSVPATELTIPYRAFFGVSYRYDAATHAYARFDDGVREVDGATGQAIAARNIVVIQTEVHFTTDFGLDPAGNPKLEEVLIGSGKGVVFRDGRRQDVTWSRDHIISAFTLRDAAGQVVELEPGQTWVHVVPTDWTISSQ